MINYKGFLFKDNLILLTGGKVSRAVLWRLIFFISQIQIWLKTLKEILEIGNLHVFPVKFDKHDISCISSMPGSICKRILVTCSFC